MLVQVATMLPEQGGPAQGVTAPPTPPDTVAPPPIMGPVFT